MKECDICHKKMPANVLQAHKVKRHGQTSADYSAAGLDLKPETVVYTPQCECLCQKLERCASCGELIPSFVMPYHARIKHGV